MTAHEIHDDVQPGFGAPEPGTDSPVEDWFGQSVAEDAELADKLADAVGEEEAERQLEAQAQGEHEDATEAQRLLAVYLRDHHAASVAGVALVRRCHDNNLSTGFEAELHDLVTEIEDDAERLTAAMAALGVEPSLTKDVAARAGEFVARLKSNGRLVQYSPTSRVLELEGLVAGITAKRQLWRSLGAAEQSALDASDLETLSSRADRQIGVAEHLHSRAVTVAFGS